jgi:hypothetical protein
MPGPKPSAIDLNDVERQELDCLFVGIPQGSKKLSEHGLFCWLRWVKIIAKSLMN